MNRIVFSVWRSSIFEIVFRVKVLDVASFPIFRVITSCNSLHLREKEPTGMFATYVAIATSIYVSHETGFKIDDILQKIGCHVPPTKMFNYVFN